MRRVGTSAKTKAATHTRSSLARGTTDAYFGDALINILPS